MRRVDGETREPGVHLLGDEALRVGHVVGESGLDRDMVGVESPDIVAHFVVHLVQPRRERAGSEASVSDVLVALRPGQLHDERRVQVLGGAEYAAGDTGYDPRIARENYAVLVEKRVEHPLSGYRFVHFDHSINRGPRKAATRRSCPRGPSSGSPRRPRAGRRRCRRPSARPSFRTRRRRPSRRP